MPSREAAPESFTEAFTGAQLPDHIGAQKASGLPR
jgi:hypothetical protein